MAQLPDKYDMDTYVEFFKKWGTHYREAVILGGDISLKGFTSTSYLSD